MRESYRCAVLEGCKQPPAIVHPVPLCAWHRMEIVAAALPEIVTAAKDAAEIVASSGDVLVSRATVVILPASLPNRHLPVVYFLSNGDRVKIGTTKNIRQRIVGLSLRMSDVLLVLRGDGALERALHRRFADQRIGSTEWFHDGPEIRAYLSDREQNGPKTGLEFHTSVASAYRQSTETARIALDDRISELKASGVHRFGVSKVADLPMQVGRSRPWLYMRLDELVAEGRLIKTGSGYVIP